MIPSLHSSIVSFPSCLLSTWEQDGNGTLYGNHSSEMLAFKSCPRKAWKFLKIQVIPALSFSSVVFSFCYVFSKTETWLARNVVSESFNNVFMISYCSKTQRSRLSHTRRTQDQVLSSEYLVGRSTTACSSFSTPRWIWQCGARLARILKAVRDKATNSYLALSFGCVMEAS